MRVLALSGSRTINVVLRDYADSDSYEVVLTNKNNDSTESVSVTKTESEINLNMGQLQIPITSEYNEGQQYEYEVTENGSTEALFRGKLYFTDQDPQEYNING